MTAEERFKEMIDGMVIRHVRFPNTIWYYKDGKFLFYQDIKTGVCCISWANIWSVLESKFGVNYHQIKELTTIILKQHIKHKVVTTHLPSP